LSRITNALSDERQTVTARRGVILAAGALRTPQLLMLSGVGPAGHLSAHGIPVLADLPGVGGNLHDHPMITPVWPITSGTTLLDAGDDASVSAYRLARRGPQGVADASVMPTITRGNTHAPTILIAERAASLLADS
jgi:choline dehydrogenase-like flavoprotein